MDIEKMLLKAIAKQDILNFLRGKGEYMIEYSQFVPSVGVTDVGKVLSKGVYKIYAYDVSIKCKLEESLLHMLDNSDFDIYMVCLYLVSQLFKERNRISPFELSKDSIVKKLGVRISERESDIKGGILYPNGYVNMNAMTEIQRFRKICKEQYSVVF